MQRATFKYSSGDGTAIVAYRWEPDGPPIAIVQVTHGMGEHALRYDRLAGEFTRRDVVVYAQDHRGHGASALSAERLGDLGPGGWPALVDDIGLLTEHARAEHPGLPLMLLAHSMGSFAAQQFLLDHSNDVDAVVLTGTAALDLMEPAIEVDQPLDLAMFNAPFAPARTDFDWLSRDESVVDDYLADPLCGFGLEPSAVRAMFDGARRLADPEQVARMRDDLPVHVAAGALDPINGGRTLLDPILERYRAAGLCGVTAHVYEGARHEILNETNRAEVIRDLIGWMQHVLGVPAVA